MIGSYCIVQSAFACTNSPTEDLELRGHLLARGEVLLSSFDAHESRSGSTEEQGVDNQGYILANRLGGLAWLVLRR